MSDTKLSALTELDAAPAASDELYLNDGGTSKKITVANLMKGVTVDDSTVEVDASNGLQVKDGGIDTTQLAADAVTGAKIEDDAVDSEHIAAGAIDIAHMSANSVDSDQYVDGSIDTAHLANDAVTNDKLANDAVDSDQIADGSIDTAHIADNQVTAAKLDDAAVSAVAREYSAAQNFNETTLTDAATVAWDCEANQVCKVTLGGNRTLGAATNQKAGAFYCLRCIQDGTGTRTLAFNANYHFAGGSAPTLTTTANAVDILTFFSNGTNMILVGTALDVKAA